MTLELQSVVIPLPNPTLVTGHLESLTPMVPGIPIRVQEILETDDRDMYASSVALKQNLWIDNHIKRD